MKNYQVGRVNHVQLSSGTKLEVCAFCPDLPEPCCWLRPEFFLLVDLRDFFFRFMVEGTEKKTKKALKMTSSELFFFRAFFFFFQSFFFFNISRKNSKTSKVNTNSLY